MTDTGLNFTCKDRKRKRGLENVVWTRKKEDMNKTLLWIQGKKEGYSQTTALGKRGLYHCQQHCKWQANELSLREMIMSSQTFKMLMIIKNIARPE